MTKHYTQLAYTSIAVRDFSDSMLADMLISFRKNNHDNDITGVLIHYKQCFIQVIEGPKQSIDALWEKLVEDDRHKLVTRILYRSIEQRMFSDWSMAYERFKQDSEVFIDGFCDLFHIDQVFTKDTEQEVIDMIESFKKIL